MNLTSRVCENPFYQAQTSYFQQLWKSVIFCHFWYHSTNFSCIFWLGPFFSRRLHWAVWIPRRIYSHPGQHQDNWRWLWCPRKRPWSSNVQCLKRTHSGKGKVGDRYQSNGRRLVNFRNAHEFCKKLRKGFSWNGGLASKFLFSLRRSLIFSLCFHCLNRFGSCPYIAVSHHLISFYV